MYHETLKKEEARREEAARVASNLFDSYARTGNLSPKEATPEVAATAFTTFAKAVDDFLATTSASRQE